MRAARPLPHQRKHRHPAQITVMVMRFLRDGPASINRIAESLRLDYQCVEQHVEALVRSGAAEAGLDGRNPANKMPVLTYSLLPEWRG